MSKVSYSDIPAKLSNFQDFEGNSMSAQNWDGGTVYEVKSYQTQILSINLKDGTYRLNEDHYSPTTSHHQNIVRRFLALENSRRILAGRETLENKSPVEAV